MPHSLSKYLHIKRQPCLRGQYYHHFQADLLSKSWYYRYSLRVCSIMKQLVQQRIFLHQQRSSPDPLFTEGLLYGYFLHREKYFHHCYSQKLYFRISMRIYILLRKEPSQMLQSLEITKISDFCLCAYSVKFREINR